MSRAKVFGPNSTFSFTKLGQLDRDRAADSISKRTKDLIRLESQRFVQKDSTRERRYNFCTKCGITTVTIGFDKTPSARIGLWGRCVDNKDYTHHRMTHVSQGEYQRLRDMPVQERLSFWRYQR